MYICIEALDPPTGNIHIRSSNNVSLLIFDARYVIGMNVQFQEVVDGRFIKLQFPKQLLLGKQRRSSYRVPVNADFGIKSQLTRASKIQVDIDLVDISVGGASFQFHGQVARIMDGCKIALQFKWDRENINILLWATVLETFTREGDSFFRCRFNLEATDCSLRSIEEFVGAIQRIHLQKRLDNFISW